jgi:3-hydroxybutyryl-CoA dehydrogenase
MAAMEEVAIIGSGIMGAGIAQVMSTAGLRVLMYDISDDFLSKAMGDVKGSLGRMVKKKSLSQSDADAILGRIKTIAGSDYSALSGADLILEVVPEQIAIKEKVWKALCAVAKPTAVLATNTSSISITKINGLIPAEMQPRFAGFHFFNPVPVMKLVEVIRGLQTSDATVETLMQLGKRIGKTPVPCLDSPGFVCNRILVPMINEAIFAVFEGVATPADIDQVMKLGANHPMGPLALADMIGLDTILSVMEVMHREFGDPKYRACPLLRKMVDAKHLGRKTGKGFYDYKQSKL